MTELEEAIRFTKYYLFQPVTLPDSKVAADFLQRVQPVKSTRQKKRTTVGENGEILSENEVDYYQDELDDFVVNGHVDSDGNDMSASEPEIELDGTHRKRHRRNGDHKQTSKKRRLKMNEEQIQRAKRELQEQEVRQFKSSEYIHESDDDLTPEELQKFFESEERIRQQYGSMAMAKQIEIERQQLETSVMNTATKLRTSETESEDEDVGNDSKLVTASVTPQRTLAVFDDSEESEKEYESSNNRQPKHTSVTTNRQSQTLGAEKGDFDNLDKSQILSPLSNSSTKVGEDADTFVVKKKIRTGFVIDSDEDED